MQSLLNTLSGNSRMFGMRLSLPKCKLLLQDWSSAVPQLRIETVVIECADHFIYLRSRISPGGSVANEISARIQKTRLAFANLRHLWCCRDIRLSIKGHVYYTAVRSVLLYGCETWLLKVEDMRRLQVFDHRCLRSIGRIPWCHHVSNAEVRSRVLGSRGKSVDEVMNLQRLRWLGHLLRMPSHRLPHHTMLAEVG
ncbi:unnamed protein product [Heterobilharzia americana]|nr:unnamed protein product [Heterobilharzia americana]